MPYADLFCKSVTMHRIFILFACTNSYNPYEALCIDCIDGLFVPDMNCQPREKDLNCYFRKHKEERYVVQFKSLGATWSCMLHNSVIECDVTSVKAMELRCQFENMQTISQGIVSKCN